MRPYQKILQKLEGIKTVLDLGCGDGTLDVFLAKKGGIRVVGLDTSAKGFNHAEKKALSDGVEDLVTCAVGSVYDMAFAKDGEFEAAILVYVLHHIEDPISALKESRRVLRPGGKILIVECIAGDEEGMVCWTFDKPGIIAILNHAGFLKIHVEILGRENGHEFILIAAEK